MSKGFLTSLMALTLSSALMTVRQLLVPLVQGSPDWLGVSRTIDHAVYTGLNALAIILWRLNSAIMSMSLFSYSTQDWLTNGADGGVWQVMDLVIGPGGLFGLETWQLVLTLAIMLFGLARVLRPFLPTFNPVDVGWLLIFGTFSFVVVQQGSSLMQRFETWRADLGGYMYQAVAADGRVDITVPGVDLSGSEPLQPPADLDGRSPIRGWEAVATSYFLADSEADLSRGIPPDTFRRTYCLYDPNQPINEQAEENEQGCSPRKVWDEWDVVSTGVITEVFGIELPVSIGME
ncbi:MAG: hypothetical protein KDI79_00195, partial [Anaerolineae bacterium]|nr:hypothetical protein [Anaerolineae bacterium]